EARIQEEEDAEELYRDVNINQGRGFQVTQNVEDTHVILTPVNPNDPQESSSMSSFVSSMLNPLSDFADAVSVIPGIVHQYMDQQMKEAVREAVQIQTDRLQDSLQWENDEFLHNIDENMKKVLKGLVKDQDPPLDQTGGPKDKKKEVSRHQLALPLKRQPRVLA
nr:hypothetical protein [Tanacetum cinerariifolium]